MTMNHVMVDLETMGTRMDSVIVSLGAVAFDPDSGKLGEQFLVTIDPQSCLDAGLVVEGGTLLWWLRQSEAVRDAIASAELLPLEVALYDFSQWWEERLARYIWSHGACFDVPMLDMAYRKSGRSAPWKFWDARDTRTLFDITNTTVDRAKGTHHNALDDSINQAKAVIRAYRSLRSEAFA